MTEQELESFAGLTPSGIVARLERRVEQSKRYGRDVDELFRHLAQGVAGPDWPASALDRLELAVRAFRAASAWSVRVDPAPRTMRATTEGSVVHIHTALAALRDGAALPCAEQLIDAWSESQLLPRSVFADVLLDAADAQTLRAIELSVMRRAHRLRHQVTALMDTLTAGTDVPTASAREHTLLHARLQSRAGRLDDALSTLDQEPISDPKVTMAFADVLLEHGQREAAVDRLRRCLVVSLEKRLVRERLIDVYLELGDVDQAIDQAMQVLSETGDVLAWDVICEALGAEHGDKLRAVRDALETENPQLFVDILIAQGDVEGVVRASKAKTFSYEQLWRIGDFLAADGTSRAARVYERAINLQGAVAQSKLQCQDFGARLEAVAPYFVAIERPTKLQRLAKEVMAQHRNNVPLRREFERVFGPGFK